MEITEEQELEYLSTQLKYWEEEYHNVKTMLITTDKQLLKACNKLDKIEELMKTGELSGEKLREILRSIKR